MKEQHESELEQKLRNEVNRTQERTRNEKIIIQMKTKLESAQEQINIIDNALEGDKKFLEMKK